MKELVAPRPNRVESCRSLRRGSATSQRVDSSVFVAFKPAVNQRESFRVVLDPALEALLVLRGGEPVAADVASLSEGGAGIVIDDRFEFPPVGAAAGELRFT